MHYIFQLISTIISECTFTCFVLFFLLAAITLLVLVRTQFVEFYNSFEEILEEAKEESAKLENLRNECREMLEKTEALINSHKTE